MAGQDELAYLKGLVKQLNEKIETLEKKAKSAVTGKPTPAQQLRTILVGPPGAGEPRTTRIPTCVVLRNVCRQGHASSQDQGGVLCLPPGYW